MERIAHLLPQSLIKQIASHGDVRLFPAGTLLFHEGDPAEALYLLLAGQLKVYSCHPNGREVVYNLMSPGELLGEMTWDGGPRSASVKAMVDSECVVVSGNCMRVLLANPEFAEWLVLTLIARLRTATRKIRSLALDGVYERVATLLEEAAVVQDDERCIPRALTQLEIAQRVGASREMVNHVLRDLIRGGFISKDKQHRMTIVKKLPKHW